MLRAAWFVATKDAVYMLRQKETMLWTFVMPVLFFFLFGTVTGGFSGGGEAADKIAMLAPADAGWLADELERRLEEAEYEVVRVESEAELADYRRRLTLPAAMTDSALSGVPVTLHFVRDGNGLGNEFDEVRLTRAVYTVLADLAVTTHEGNPEPAAFASLAAEPRPLTLETRRAGKRKRIPRGFEQSIPGTMVMFTLLVLLTSGAVLLVIERQQGLLRRLAATPITRGAVVLGKWGGKMALGLVQIAFALLTGALLFRMDWGPNLPMVLVVLFAYACLVAALGLLLGSFARSEGQAVGLGVLSANVLAALGGCWWPIEITPDWMQGLAKFLPTGVAMDALHKLVSFGLEPSSAVPHALILLAAAVVAGWWAARVFRYE